MPENELSAFIAKFSPDGLELSAARLLQELTRRRCLTAYQAKILSDGGSIEFGNYVIWDLAGNGVAGTVYQAIDRSTGDFVALRLVVDEMIDPVRRGRDFEQTVEPAVYLTHCNVIDHLDVGVRHGRRYIATEFSTGVTLFEKANFKDRISVIDSLAYSLQAAHGLAHSHSHELYHGAISPQNFFVDSDHLLKISDLGIGRLRTRFALAELLNKKGVHASTFDFIAPERFKNVSRCDEHTDIYELGCVLFFLLAGKAPFAGRTPADKQRAHLDDPIPRLADYRDDVSISVQVLLDRMMDKAPRQRFGKMEEVVDAISHVLETIEGGAGVEDIDGSAIEKILLPEKQKSDRPSKRPNGLALYAATTLVVAAALLTWFGFNWNQDNSKIDKPDSPPPVANQGQSVASQDNDRSVGNNAVTPKPKNNGSQIVDNTGSNDRLSPAINALTLAIDHRLATHNRRPVESVEVGEIRRLGVGDVVIRESQRVTTDEGEMDRIRDLIAQGERIEVKRLDLSQTAVGDAELKNLSPLTTLASLSLFQCDHVTDEGMRHLRTLNNLESVDLRGTFITAAGLASLPEAPIQSIMINSIRNQMSGNAIDLLAERYDASLTTLWIDGVSLGEEEFRSLRQLTSLKDLRLTYVGIPNEWLHHLRDLEDLVNLNLAGNDRIDNGSLNHLEQMVGLKDLNLISTSVTNRKVFTSSLASCRIVWE